MESKEFLSYITNPTSVNADSLKKLEDTLKEYPFCQSAQLLYAFNLYMQQHPGYAVQLKRAAAFASDRKRLKELIEQHKRVQVKPVPQTLPVPPVTVPPIPQMPPTRPVSRVLPVISSPSSPPSSSSPLSFETKVVFTPVSPSEKEDRESAVREKLLEVVHRRLAEIAREQAGNRVSTTTVDEQAEPERNDFREETMPPVRISFSVEHNPPMSKEELIEKFIREEPKISSPRTAFLRPNPPTAHVERDDDEIVSETLAILYHKQGNTRKSIRVYEKLRLLFPEKSGYFAGRINELKKADASGTQGNEPYGY